MAGIALAALIGVVLGVRRSPISVTIGLWGITVLVVALAGFEGLWSPFDLNHLSGRAIEWAIFWFLPFGLGRLGRSSWDMLKSS